MNPTKQMCDLLGRTKKLQLAVLKLLAALLVIPGSAWPSQARSMGASYDMRFEPRPKMPIRGDPVATRRVSSVELRVEHFAGRRHLPVIHLEAA